MNSNLPPTAGIQHDGVTRAQRIEFRIKSQKALIDGYSWQTCLTCECWDTKQEICAKFNARPPLDVVLVGCVEYNEAIPF